MTVTLVSRFNSNKVSQLAAKIRALNSKIQRDDLKRTYIEDHSY